MYSRSDDKDHIRHPSDEASRTVRQLTVNHVSPLGVRDQVKTVSQSYGT